MNIVYLHSHDTGRYLQPYGHAVSTPRLQRLAEQGVLFRQAFCAAPTCSPSRAALLTGQAAHSAGMLGLAHRGFALNHHEQHLAHLLKNAGYVTALAGVQHVARSANAIGYDHVLSTQGNQAAQVAPAAADFIADVGRDRPFFLDVGFLETHRVFPEPGESDDSRYCLPPAPLPDTPETRRDIAAYKTSARRLDTGVGIVLDALEVQGLAADTLVISTTDHGIAFPGMKCSLSDHGIGVSLIVRGPAGGDFAGGKVVDGMVSHLDLFPTVCDLIGIERPAWLQGKSLIPLVRGETNQINEAIFAEVTFHAAFEPKRAVRTTGWKYIRHFDDRGRPVLPNCDDSPSKTVWLEAGWRGRFVAREQLFDLSFDPNEAANVAGDPVCAAVLAEMRARLDAWMEATDDPLLRPGSLPVPAGILVNDADGLSPQEPPGAWPA